MSGGARITVSRAFPFTCVHHKSNGCQIKAMKISGVRHTWACEVGGSPPSRVEWAELTPVLEQQLTSCLVW